MVSFERGIILDNRYKKIKQILWIILFANFLIAVIKLIIGICAKSTSITADGFHSLTDGSSNIVGLIAIKLAFKPIDKKHPYGHKKFEILAGLVIAGMLAIIGGKIIHSAVLRFINPVTPTIKTTSLIILVASLVVNVFVCSIEFKKGKKYNSQILISDSMHTKSDIYVSVGVLLTLICIKLGLPPIIDPIASFIVAGFVLYAAYEIFKVNSNILVDSEMMDSKKIEEIALSFEAIKSVHKIRSRGIENDIYVDMHIMLEPSLSIEEAHTILHELEEKLANKTNYNVDIMSHIEPFKPIQIAT